MQVTEVGASNFEGGQPWPAGADGRLRPATPPGAPWLARVRAADGRRVARLAGLAVLLGVFYALGALLPFWYLQSPADGAAFFPPAGLSLAIFLLTPRRTWPIWLVVIATAEITVDLTHHEGVAMALGFALANTVEPVVGTQLLLKGGRTWARQWSNHRAALLRYVLFAIVAAPLVGAAIGATTSALSPGASNWWTTFGNWWLGDALGVLIIATPILAWSRRSRYESSPPLGILALMVVVAVSITIVPAMIWRQPVVYALLPVLVWAAFTGGTRAVSVVGVGIAAAVDWVTITGRAGRLLAPAPPHRELVFLQIFLALTILTGMTLAVEIAERRRTEAVARRADTERARSEQATVKIAEAERRGITQDTHDIVGHGLNVMLLQVGAARRVFDSDPALARELLDSSEMIGRRACKDLDIALAMTTASPDLQPGRGLENLPELVDAVRNASMRVELVTAGDRPEISTLVDWSAYRIVQEALTNVAKHAPGASVVVTVHYRQEEVWLSVVDDGWAESPTARNGEGRGIIGMRERAVALGGELEVGPVEPRGFAVRARLPL
jgi:signal transduction histidine kinase